MLNFTLKSEPPIGFKEKIFKDLKLIEETGLSIVSMSVPKNNFKQLEKSIFENYKITLPVIGKSKTAKLNDSRFLALQPDQYFIIFDNKTNYPVEELNKSLRKEGYFSDQSDSWSIINISGKNTINALERICPLNLSSDVFTIGNVNRTSMEHIGVIMVRITIDQFILLSPRSSSSSFYHAIVTSIENIL